MAALVGTAPNLSYAIAKMFFYLGVAGTPCGVIRNNFVSLTFLLKVFANKPVSDSAKGYVLVDSKMHHFQFFGNYEFRTNLKSRYRSLTNLVKISQEIAFSIKCCMIFFDFPNIDRQNLIFVKRFAWKTAKNWYLLKQPILWDSELF